MNGLQLLLIRFGNISYKLSRNIKKTIIIPWFLSSSFLSMDEKYDFQNKVLRVLNYLQLYL